MGGEGQWAMRHSNQERRRSEDCQLSHSFRWPLPCLDQESQAVGVEHQLQVPRFLRVLRGPAQQYQVQERQCQECHRQLPRELVEPRQWGPYQAGRSGEAQREG